MIIKATAASGLIALLSLNSIASNKDYLKNELEPQKLVKKKKNSGELLTYVQYLEEINSKKKNSIDNGSSKSFKKTKK